MPKVTPMKTVTSVDLELNMNEAADLLHVLSFIDNKEMKSRMKMSRQFRARVLRVVDSLASIEPVLEKMDKRYNI